MSLADIIVKIQAERLKELLGWRRYLPYLVEAVKQVFGEEAEIYVIGSAVEGKLTVDSDIDVLVVVRELPRSGLERARIIDRVWRIMEGKGVPWWYPFEIHLVTRRDLEILEERYSLQRYGS